MKIVNKSVQSDQSSHQTKKKLCMLGLHEKNDVMACVMKTLVLFATYHARVAGPKVLT